MPTRRAILASALGGGCTTRPMPAPPLGAGRLLVAAESWHTDLCLPTAALAGTPLAPVAGVPGRGGAMALGFGLDSWMRADRPGSAELLAALSGGPAVVWMRALDGPFPAGAEDVVPLRLPAGGTAAIAAFVAGQVAAPLPALRPGRSVLVPSRLPYALDFTCNTWVMQALALAGLPVPVAGIRLRSGAMAAIHAEAARQAGR